MTTVNLIANNIGSAINSDAFDISDIFSDANNAVDQLRNETEGKCTLLFEV